ncbi:DNA mismatch repair protein MSH6 [Apostasia shenzhenica]|uniref:DNA mismatch repair protein MSH6 n=1 Tax=Apostasia shenzhenica TaxID=1088818 RepID=A0A2I0AW92_9ASPA|nr:DNA mismatch repair protein MSH6 [Apostasia shenzhenica]
MAQKLLQEQLREVGSKLENPPASKDALIKLLKQAASFLSELEQSPLPSMLDAMKPCLSATAKEELLKHQDRDVRVLVATCICEITRITAPEAPYSDDVLKDIFNLIVSTFSGLNDINSPSFERRVVILETLARYRSCVVMLDLECHDLINEMFNTFFSVISDGHPKNVQTSMQTIMVLILDESEDIQENLLVTLLSPLGRKRIEFSMAARRLAMNVIEHCAGKLEHSIRHFLVSSLSGDSSYLDTSLDYHEVIYDIYQCAPQILSGIIPYMTGELLTDKLEIRHKAVQLLGELFALPGYSIAESFQPLFSEFVKRLTDRVVHVRVSVIEHLKNCLLSNTSRPEAPMIIKALCDRLLDYDENVRKQVVSAIYDLACHSMKVISADTAKRVADRLRDKSLSVKRYTMERLAHLYKFYCLNCSDDSVNNEDFEWIPGRILRCLYDKDFRSETIEFIMCGMLFPPDLATRDRVKHWIKAFSALDKVEVKALEQILLQKQRLQIEFQKCLALRRTHQGDAPELQKRLSGSFRIMSRMFHDAANAEEGFQMLHQLKDLNIWKLLTSLLDDCTSFCKAWSSREELLKILGEKHPLYEFMSMLSVKCSYLLFNKEHVKEMILEVAEKKFARDSKIILSCMDLLTVIASFSPQLFIGSEDDLVGLLKEDDDIIKEGATHVLAKAGETIREQLATTSSSIDLLLERLCVEGTRKQAKYSVQALAAITKDDGLKSLSVLYKRLVDMLEEKTHLLSILQSLGCIAQTAMPVFETREDEIVEFLKKKVLERSDEVSGSSDKIEWNERSELCSLKIFGIKTLVKSYLPVKDAPSRTGIDELVGMLRNILMYGNISKDLPSSAVDKAHMRLTAAKSILRLSRLWDHRIPLDVFYMTLRISEELYPQSRKLFINKVHQYIKERLLDAKYACAFLLNIDQYQSPEYKEAKHNIIEVVQICQQLKLRQLSMQSDMKDSVIYPESILVYLIHAIAHHASCPDINECRDLTAFEPIYWRLHLFLSVLLHGDEGWQSGSCADRSQDCYATVVSILHSIKCSKDTVDCAKSIISHAISDLGLSITKKLIPDQADSSEITKVVSLPGNLYKAHEKNEENAMVNCEQSWLSGEGALAHFESLMFDDKEEIVSLANKDDIIFEDKDKDDNEVPLGKMLKLLKSHGTKKKKPKLQTSNTGLKNKDEDIDVLGMVREINLDLVEAAHSAQKMKINEASTMDVLTPKRKRSRSFKRSSSSNLDMKRHTSFIGSELLISASPETHIFPSSKGKKKGDRSNTEEETFNVKKFSEDPKKKTSGSKSLSNSGKKRKIRSISGLSKFSSNSSHVRGKDLIGCRIKVWWPLDKQFYVGVVRSYDPEKRKHSILYDDGDVEVLQLKKEKWELIPNGGLPEKPPKNRLFSSHEQLSCDPSSQRNDKFRKRPATSSVGKGQDSKKGSGEDVRKVPESHVNESKSDVDSKVDSEVSDVHLHSQSESDDESSGTSLSFLLMKFA